MSRVNKAHPAKQVAAFKGALSADLRAVQLDRRQLADKLGITVQAIAKWVSKGEVPNDRRNGVAAVLGKDATCLQYRAEMSDQLADDLLDVKRLDFMCALLAIDRQHIDKLMSG